jgi:hypothetical protein
MELRQLEYFVAVAEEASFTRAARRVHISQSGVSAQIRQPRWSRARRTGSSIACEPVPPTSRWSARPGRPRPACRR